MIFGLLRNSKKADTSADSFVPLLIYVVLHANPDHLVSNIQYILRFRNQDKLGGEAGYYLSSLVSLKTQRPKDPKKKNRLLTSTLSLELSNSSRP